MSSHLGNNDFIASDIHIENRKRLRRRSGDVLPVQIELTVMAGAHDQFLGRIVLDGAVQMRAARRESPQLTLCRAYQKTGLSSELKNRSSVEGHIIWTSHGHGHYGRLGG